MWHIISMGRSENTNHQDVMVTSSYILVTINNLYGNVALIH